jgi:uncharacterized protein YbjT (DUF2867 family)
MSYVITGSLGNISKPIVEKLVAAGKQVSVITSNHDRVAEIEALGAKALVGSVEDADFVTKSFAGAEAVYTMVPPAWGATDWKAHIGKVGKIYAGAIAANNIKYVVNLSSVGAHLPDGVGPVSGLYSVEASLNQLADTNVLHLRPGFFYSNFFASIGLVKNQHILGNNYAKDSVLVLSDTSDIAEAAADALLHQNFTGHSVKYLFSDERTAADIAKVLGEAIGNPSLPWIEFTDEQSVAGLLGAGLSQEVAVNYTEMGASLRKGIMAEDFYKNKPEASGKVKLEDFAQVFAQVYSA